MKNPIPPISPRQVTQDSTLPWINKEAIPVIRAMKNASDAEPTVATTSTASDGAGTLLTLWSEVIPTNRAWYVSVEVVGYSTTVWAAYMLSALFRNVAGTAAQVGSTASIAAIESAAGCNATLSISSTTISLKARDDAAAAMTWRAVVKVFSSEEA